MVIFDVPAIDVQFSSRTAYLPLPISAYDHRSTARAEMDRVGGSSSWVGIFSLSSLAIGWQLHLDLLCRIPLQVLLLRQTQLKAYPCTFLCPLVL